MLYLVTTDHFGGPPVDIGFPNRITAFVLYITHQIAEGYDSAVATNVGDIIAA